VRSHSARRGESEHSLLPRVPNAVRDDRGRLFAEIDHYQCDASRADVGSMARAVSKPEQRRRGAGDIDRLRADQVAPEERHVVVTVWRKRRAIDELWTWCACELRVRTSYHPPTSVCRHCTV